jgi:class 3 adenylate cyclase/tetratricopeptide (TPR) repeat protein
MFCDLVGSTALAEGMDPEDYRELLRAYYAICGDAVDHYDGHVAQHLGDGVLIYFGYPSAHDDDARRAVMAGLEMAVAVPALRRVLFDGREVVPTVRIGIHTGLTVVGEAGLGSGFETLAVGNTPNIAARLQQLAVPGEVVISDTTRHLVGGDVELQDLGEQVLKGISEPMRVHRVVGTRAAPRPLRLDREVFVGRQRELGLIEAVFADVRAGHERAIAICGEPGMGKSRLISAVMPRLGAAAPRWAETGCSPFFRNTALFPLAQLVRAEAGIASSDTSEEVLTKLKGLVGRTGPEEHELTALLAGLVVGPELHDDLEYSAEVRKERTLGALKAVLRGMAAAGPAVVVVEDLQWADPSTLEVLAGMIDHPSDAPLLLLVTYRPELSGWPPEHGLVHIRLAPLDPVDVEELIGIHADDDHPAQDLVRGIVARADGVPLFVEELVKATHGPGGIRIGAAADDHAIPATLHGLLTARLDQLRPSKRVAQLGAVLGRRFAVEVLARLAGEPTDFDRELEQLVQAEVLVPAGGGDRPEYEFRHALIQEAAYDSLLRSDRRRLHGQLASVYEAHYPEEVDAHPEVVGYHWRQSGRHDHAAPYLKAAADRSAQVHAHEEALVLYEQTARSVEAILSSGGEADPSWVDLFLDVHERAGDILTLLRRGEEAERLYRSALDRCTDPVRAAGLHRRIGVVHEQDRLRALPAFAEAEHALGPDDTSRELAWRREWLSIQLGHMRMSYWYDDHEEMAKIAGRIRPFIDGDVATPLQRAQLFDQLTLMHFRQERYAMSDEALRSAQDYVRAAEAVEDLQELASARFTFGFALMFRGRPDEAIEQLEAALDLTRRSGHRTIEIRCLSYLATAHRMVGHVDEAARFSQLGQEEAELQGMVEYVGVAFGNLAWVALTEARMDDVRRLAARAQGAWSTFEMAWPFRWIGLLPLLAAAYDDGDDGALASSAAGMVEPGQQRLPGPLAGALERVAAGASRGDSAAARAAAADALQTAASLGFLARRSPGRG